MFQSDYDLVGGQQFFVKVAKTPEGGFQAHSPSAPEVPPVRAATQSGAIQKMNDALNAFQERQYKK